MPSYHLTAIALRTYRLAETDKIVVLLAQDGSLVRAVAKGARKPRSRFANRLEPGCVLDLLCHTGRNLDIIQEARVEAANTAARRDLAHLSGVEAVCEALSRIAVEGQELPRIFDLSVAALDAIGRASAAQVPLLTAAHLLKAVSIAGVRPALAQCASCGEDLEPLEQGRSVAFSYEGGGRICDRCRGADPWSYIDPLVVSDIGLCIGSTFDRLLEADIDASRGLALLEVCDTWLSVHLDVRLKSLPVMRSTELWWE